MIAATVVDGVDGWLARLARVDQRASGVDGRRLDDIVDYVTYVFVPAALMLRSSLLPAAIAWPVAATVLLSSAFGFSRTDAKTADHFFTGFPSYWNIVALYLFAMGLDPGWNAAIIVVLAILVFVPIGYIYPSRTVEWQVPTLVLGAIWSAAMIGIAWRLPDVWRPGVFVSLLFPLYYVVLSLVLHVRRSVLRS